ncbi:glutathione S-transferase family protein [Sorangium sp. So ce861]|uniref:glutathione S-transferase family protein n=1 Tax=Sorangium sp. So ce861 TaxID=3133323 RepID=UPI003F615153
MSAQRAVYFVNGSISSWRVLLAVREKGLAFEPRRLRVMREPRETRAPEFLALNPRGQAPVLVEPDGTVVNESLAILTYMEMRYPDPPLLPPPTEPGALARARPERRAFAQGAGAALTMYSTGRPKLQPPLVS